MTDETPDELEVLRAKAQEAAEAYDDLLDASARELMIEHVDGLKKALNEKPTAEIVDRWCEQHGAYPQMWSGPLMLAITTTGDGHPHKPMPRMRMAVLQGDG